MSRLRSAIALLQRLLTLVTIVSALAIGQSARASIIANLYANPSNINEGQTTNLQLTLNYFAPAPGYYSSSAYTYSGNTASNLLYYYSGAGQINTFNGTINSGDGQSASIGGTVNNQSASQTRSFTYNSPSTYLASVTGTANVQDNFNYYVTQWQYFGQWIQTGQFGPFPSGPGSPYNLSFNASTQVFVNNLSPSITHLAWDLVAYVGDAVSFAASGYDPAGIGTTETMTFAYDLNNDGNYNDYSQIGSLTSSGVTNFQTAGVHSVGVRLTDGRGGTAYASFDVNVLDRVPIPGAPEVPEPATLFIWGVLGIVGASYARVARSNSRSLEPLS
jgi:hypothetical protein